MKRYLLYSALFASLAVLILVAPHSKWTYPVAVLDIIMALVWLNRWRKS